MAYVDYEHIIEQITYKPGWSFHYRKGMFCHWMIVTAKVTDSHDISRIIEFDVMRMIPENAFDSEIEFVNWVKSIIMDTEFHELREFFRFSGELVDDPHATKTVRDE